MPLAPESAFALAITTAIDAIEAQRGYRDKPILEVIQNRQTVSEKSKRKHGNRPKHCD